MLRVRGRVVVMSRTPGSHGQVYGRGYQRRRQELLASKPLCFWGCGRVATTADHWPDVELGGGPDDLVPACAPCNYGRPKGQPPKHAQTVTPSREWF